MTGVLRVTKTLEGKHPLHRNYPLLPGDLLTRSADGTYAKHAPGLGVVGFELSAEDVESLEPATDARWEIA